MYKAIYYQSKFRAGLQYAGRINKDEEGEMEEEWIGTTPQWELAYKLEGRNYKTMDELETLGDMQADRDAEEKETE